MVAQLAQSSEVWARTFRLRRNWGHCHQAANRQGRPPRMGFEHRLQLVRCGIDAGLARLAAEIYLDQYLQPPGLSALTQLNVTQPRVTQPDGSFVQPFAQPQRVHAVDRIEELRGPGYLVRLQMSDEVK